jgi:hypothetical protein
VHLQVDLFSARRMPQNLFEVAQREKEIRYSSRTPQHRCLRWIADHSPRRATAARQDATADAAG